MDPIKFITVSVQRELEAMGATRFDAAQAAHAATAHYRESARFSKPAYEECLEKAGKWLASSNRDFKFKKPRRKTTARAVRPPEAWSL